MAKKKPKKTERKAPAEKSAERAPAKIVHPRQQELPGMENRKLKDVHDAALDYIEARDTRMAATKPEAEAKATLLATMKAHKLERYKCADVEVLVVHEKETVKAKLIAADEQADEPRRRRARFDGKAKAANDDSFPDMPDEQRDAVED